MDQADFRVLLLTARPRVASVIARIFLDARIAHRLIVADGPPSRTSPVPDLILLDLDHNRPDAAQLPGLLKGDPALGAIPVVVLGVSWFASDAPPRDRDVILTLHEQWQVQRSETDRNPHDDSIPNSPDEHDA